MRNTHRKPTLVSALVVALFAPFLIAAHLPDDAPTRPIPAKIRTVEEAHPIDNPWLALRPVVEARLAAEAKADADLLHSAYYLRSTYEAKVAADARRRAAAAKAKARTVRRAPAAARYGSGACGGDLPPCYVMMRESRGSLTAQNPYSTASGKWQFLRGTWGGYGGYAEAWMAPESVQDARARQLWAGGAGCSHWSAC